MTPEERKQRQDAAKAAYEKTINTMGWLDRLVMKPTLKEKPSPIVRAILQEQARIDALEERVKKLEKQNGMIP